MKLQRVKTIALFLLFLLISQNSTALETSLNGKKLLLLNLIKEFHQIENKHKLLLNKKIKQIEKIYYLLLNKVNLDIPILPKPKDLFETQYEYNKRKSLYKKQVKEIKTRQKRKNLNLHKEFDLRYKTSKAEVEYIENKLKELKPVIEKIQALQAQTFPVYGENIEVILFPPEADKSRFPIHLVASEKKWTRYWSYSNRNKAKTLWENKSYLKAIMHTQFEFKKNGDIQNTITTIHVLNTKTRDFQNYKITTIKTIPEITTYYNLLKNDLPAAKLMVALKNVIKGPVAGMEFIFISPRSFLMGSSREESGRWADEIQHRVNLTKGFYAQTTEVTQGQWRAIMKTNPSFFSKCGYDCPVENVYWSEAQEFINKLNEIEGSYKYRLPTEAEWEYICRAGNKNMGAYDNNETKLNGYAWYNENSEGRTHSVALKKPNRWGLFDMHGNVSEWCSDWAGAYSSKEVSDPKGPLEGKFRVGRGGNWQMNGRNCRAADRNAKLPGDRGNTIGFRVLKSP